MPKEDYITVRRIDKVDPQDFIRLYREAGWWRHHYDEDLSFIEKVVTGSTCFVGAFHGNRMVGMGRSVSDGASDAYIQDVTVRSDFRGAGIGEKIVRMIIHDLKKRGIDWIGLIAEPGTETFYGRIGFSTLDGYIPLKLEK